MKYTGKRAWLYSSIDAPEDMYGSIKGQEKDLFDYAEQLGLLVAGTSSDLGGGGGSEKPGLGQVIAAARDGKFDALLVKSVGRLCCGVETAAKLICQFADSGVGVCSMLEGEIEPDSALSAIYNSNRRQGRLT